MMMPIPDMAASLRAGRTTARALVEEALQRIDDPAGQGPAAFIRVWHRQARAQADLMDRSGAVQASASILCGIPLSVKDLFDVRGEVTMAGSEARRNAPEAAEDAMVVRRLREAGAILVGRANMSEFAFSGIGLNRTFGTPLCPWDRAARRIPGGSSSGSAVSVADGMCAGALASDTGGSVRAPAALCGLSGFKPTSGRVPLDGVFPRSYSLDTVGPIARTIGCCGAIDAAVAGTLPSLRPYDLARARIGVVVGEPVAGLDRQVAEDYQAALSALAGAGATLVDVEMLEILEIRDVNAAGGISPAEAFSIHRNLVIESPSSLDPIFLARLRKGGEVRAADYIDACRRRRDIAVRVATTMREYDALAMPTCPVVAPLLAEVQAPEAFETMSKIVLRNCNLANFLDCCAATVPMHREGSAPTGLMLMGRSGEDRTLLELALSAETCLAARRGPSGEAR